MRNKMEVKSRETSTKHIRAIKGGCIACWKCVDACPKQVFDKVGFLWHKHIIIADSDSCIGCMKCVKVCPQGVFKAKE